MSVLDTLLSSGSGAIVTQLAGQLGITPDQATSSLSALLPALSAGIKEKLASGGTPGLSQILSNADLSKFADNPSTLATPAAVDQGKTILRNVFGSQDLTTLTTTVAEKVGVGSGVIDKLLPIAAALLGGILSKNTAAGGNASEMLDRLPASAIAASSRR